MGAKIKKLREEFNYSQEKLARVLKITRQTLSQIENEERELKANELHTLSKHFGVGTEYFFINIQKKNKNKNFNVKKFENILLYILNKCGSKPNVGETVINKLFYYIEKRFYEKFNTYITGASYRKLPFGPVPCELSTTVSHMIEKKELQKVITEYGNYPQKKYIPLIEPITSSLNKNEQKIINEIINEYSSLNARDISNLSHEENNWLRTPDGEIINFK